MITVMFLSLHFSLHHLLLVRNGFLNKKCAKQTVGAPGLANGDKVPWVMGEGRCTCSVFQKKRISNLDLKRQTLVQTGCFLYSSPKAGLNALLVRCSLECQTLAICVRAATVLICPNFMEFACSPTV